MLENNKNKKGGRVKRGNQNGTVIEFRTNDKHKEGYIGKDDINQMFLLEDITDPIGANVASD